jgi:hypothetical protein
MSGENGGELSLLNGVRFAGSCWTVTLVPSGKVMVFEFAGTAAGGVAASGTGGAAAICAVAMSGAGVKIIATAKAAAATLPAPVPIPPTVVPPLVGSIPAHGPVSCPLWPVALAHHNIGQG